MGDKAPSTIKNGTVVKRCGSPRCKNDYQDQQYGVGNRVFNRSAKYDSCTVCGHTSAHHVSMPSTTSSGSDTDTKKKGGGRKAKPSGKKK